MQKARGAAIPDAGIARDQPGPTNCFDGNVGRDRGLLVAATVGVLSCCVLIF